MPVKFLFGLDDSEHALKALQNLGSVLEPAGAHLHLFYAAPESSLFYPGELSTLSGEPEQWKKSQEGRAQAILEQAVGLLVNLGLPRSRIEKMLKLKSVNAAQEILSASEAHAPSAIALARKGRSAVKRFFLGSTTATVCQYAQNQPVWVVGRQTLKPPHLLAALDESPYAGRIISHVGEHFGRLTATRVTLFHVMPAKPPGYWDDGHILDEAERSERQRTVATWRAAYEEETGEFFLRAKSQLTDAGVPAGNIAIKRQPLVEGIARDILAEVGRGGYNILALGRRGSSAIKEFTLGSRATKMLHHPFDGTLILVN